MIRVDLDDPAVIETYGQTVAREEGRLLYAAPDYWRSLERITGAELHALTATVDGRPVGAMAWLERPLGDLGSVVNSLPWYGSHGGCNISWSVDSDPVRRALLGAFDDATRQAVCSTVVSPLDEMSWADTYRQLLSPDMEDQRLSHTSLLPVGQPDVESALDAAAGKKTRNIVRKSRSQGFKESCEGSDEDWSFLHEVHAENMAALGGRPKSRGDFEVLRQVLGARARLSVALDGTERVAALLLLRNETTVEYFTPCIRLAARSRQPLSFLIREAMVAMTGAGVGLWNWGGTGVDQESLRHFKLGWGAQEKVYRYFVRCDPSLAEEIRSALGDLLAQAPGFYLVPQQAA